MEKKNKTEVTGGLHTGCASHELSGDFILVAVENMSRSMGCTATYLFML